MNTLICQPSLSMQTQGEAKKKIGINWRLDVSSIVKSALTSEYDAHAYDTYAVKFNHNKDKYVTSEIHLAGLASEYSIFIMNEKGHFFVVFQTSNFKVLVV